MAHPTARSGVPELGECEVTEAECEAAKDSRPNQRSEKQRKKRRKRPKPNAANAIAFSVDDACSISDLSRSFLYKLMVRNVLKFRNAGARRLIVADSLRRYLANLPTA